MVIILLFLMVCYRWIGSNGHEWKSIVDGDGKGYYAYLDQIFISHNFGSAIADQDQTYVVNNHSVVKFFSGTALLISPFFLLASFIAQLFNLPHQADAEIFQKTISLAALFYLLLGSCFLIRLFKHLHLNKISILGSLTLILFATNLLAYSLFHPAMSHVYSFCAISGFLWATNRYIATNKNKFLLISALFYGLIYLIRPVNGVIILFVPFFFSDFSALLVFLKSKLRQLLIFAGIFITICLVQNMLWFIQCGSFFIKAYPYEGFYWLHPQIYQVLFSFRKGLFIYSPVLLICLLGMVTIFKENRFKSIVGLFFILMITYIISSWWCWSYFDGFGMRPFIDYFAVFALFLAYLFNKIRPWLRIVVMTMGGFCIVFNLFQTWQYTKGIIHSDYMNFLNYSYVFLKTEDKYRNCVGGSNDLIPYNKYNKTLIYESAAFPLSSEPDSANIIIPKGETEKAFVYDDKFEYNFQLTFQNDTTLFAANKLFAEIHLQKRELYPCSFYKNLMVISLNYQDNKPIFYKTFPLNYLPNQTSNQWQNLDYKIILPTIRNKNYQLKFYIWNKSLDIFLIKNLKIKIYKTS